MRFVDLFPARTRLVLAAALLLAGCASSPMKALGLSGDAKPAAPAAQTAASASATTASAPKTEAPAAPVNASTQRLFDDARRALAAGRTADAERAFVSLTKSDPDLAGPHANLGLIYRQAGKLDQSIAELEQATKLSPQQPAYFNQLAITYRFKGEFANARAAYEKAVELDGNYAQAHLNLAILLDLYLGDGRSALEHYERYLALSPAGDATVTKWVADLKNRKPSQAALTRKEQ